MKRGTNHSTVLVAFVLALGMGTAAQATHLADGLAAYWNFDELSGLLCAPNTTPAQDLTGHGNTATLNGTVRSGATVAPVPTVSDGRCALNMGGPDVPGYPTTLHFATAADSSTLDQSSSFSLSAWVMPEQIRAFQNVISKETTAGSTNYNLHTVGVDPLGGGFYDNHVAFFAITFTNQANVSLSTVSGGTAGCDSGGCFVQGNTKMNEDWHHVVARYSQSTHTLNVYVDGVLDASATFTSTSSTFQPQTNSAAVRIGARNVTDPAAWEGRLDELRIFRRSLTSSRIAALADYENFVLWLSPSTDINFAGASHTVRATIYPPLSFIPVTFVVTGSNTGSDVVGTNGYGKAYFTYTDTGTGNEDRIRAYIDADDDGLRDSTDPQDSAKKYWVNLATPDFQFCAAQNPDQTIERFRVSGGLLYSSDIRIGDTFDGASEKVCIYVANLASTNFVVTNPLGPASPFDVFYTPTGAGAVLDDGGFAINLPGGQDLFGAVTFNSIDLHNDHNLNAHVDLQFTRPPSTTVHELRINVKFRD